MKRLPAISEEADLEWRVEVYELYKKGERLFGEWKDKRKQTKRLLQIFVFIDEEEVCTRY